MSHPQRRTLIIRSSQGENPALVPDRVQGSGKHAQTLPRSGNVREIVVARAAVAETGHGRMPR